MNVNKAIIVGNLTRDPEVRTTPNGQTVTNFGLATNSYWTDKSGQKQERTEFHNIVLWGRLAEIAGQYLTKGQQAYIEGRIQTRSYTGKDGNERKITEIVGDNLQLGSRPQGGSGFTPKPKPASQNQPGKAAEEEIPTINLDDEEEIKIEDVPF